MHQDLRGIYYLHNNDIYLRFNEGDGPTFMIDSIEVKNAGYHNRELLEEEGIQFHEKYKLEKGRLYAYANGNELIRKSKHYNSKVKRWVEREYYLEKTNKK